MSNTTHFKACVKYLTPGVIRQPAGKDFTPNSSFPLSSS